MRVTLKDIAAKLGVSTSTVSMALRNDSRISEERRKEITSLAKKMGYTPDPFLSGLAAYSRARVNAKERGALAWINHWPEPERLRQFREFDAYWRGASAAAKRFGYRLDEICWGADCSPKRLERILLARGIEGVLIPPHGEVINWDDFDWNHFSVLRFGMSLPGPDSNIVSADIFRSTLMAVRRIADYGYRRIAVTVNRETNHRVGGGFLSGYFFAQRSLQLSPALPPLLTGLGDGNPSERADELAALRKWMETNRPDAILTSDAHIPGMLKTLGYGIPEDIAIAGTSVLDIPLVDTGVDQRSEVIGQVAAEMLVKQINVREKGEPRDPCRILVESAWKDGASLPRRAAACV